MATKVKAKAKAKPKPLAKAKVNAMATRRMELNFPARLVQKPFIYDLVKRFDLVPNIRRASITHDFGYMLLELKGRSSALEKALLYLRKSGVGVAPIEKDVLES